LMSGGGANHTGRILKRLEIVLAMVWASARRGSSQVEVGF
jgi:hypothetical protein